MAHKNVHTQKSIQFEVSTAKQELLLLRRARMRELLQQEARLYEQELAAKGLAIFKDRL